MSESEAAGKLIRIPGIVEAAPTNPVQKPAGVSRLRAKGFSAGFFDIVELRIANKPIVQSVKNTLFRMLLSCEVIGAPLLFVVC